MQFMIAPLTYKVMGDKQAALRRAYDLSDLITDEEILNFVLPGIIVYVNRDRLLIGCLSLFMVLI